MQPHAETRRRTELRRAAQSAAVIEVNPRDS